MTVIDRLNGALTERYLIERELGEGGMATVYLARDLRHNRNVALKVLKPELAAVVGAERFLTEIETTARLQHPNILPLFDSGEADGFLFYVMPYVQGESLQERLEREKQLPVGEAVRIATEIAEALQSAHELGVVHRDIKPANIMISQGRPLVADFGIALALSAAGGSRLTETGLSLGTPHYMSPEQATGDQVVGPASDVYSLGCVLYQMLVGEPPYTGSTAQAILGKVITSDPESVTAQRRAVPSHVDGVVARALEKLPADRFPSANDFVRALRDEGFRHGVARTGSTASRRLRVWTVAGWVVAAFLGAGLLASTLSPEEASPVRRFSLRIPPGFGPSEWLELAPDGSALVMADAPRAAGGSHSLVVQRLDDLVQIPVPETTAAFDPVFSPDGHTVAWGSSNGLYTTPVAGGSLRTLVESGSVCCLRWGRDGYLYYSSVGGVIWRVRDSGGDPELVLGPVDGTSEEFVYYQPLSGGERAILHVWVPDSGDRIEIVDITSGRRTELTEGLRPYVTGDGYLVFARMGGGLFAAPLDPGSMELTGPPVRLAEGVGVLPSSPVAMFTLSESGDLAYWTAPETVGPSRELVWVDREGGAAPVDGNWRRELESVSASPDGTRIAVTIGSERDTEIWLKELDRGPARRLTNHQGMNRRPVWAPDGATLAFISDRGGSRAVYAVPVDGISSPQLLLEHPGEDVDEFLWSRDGNWVVYRTGTTDNNRDIYARRLGPDNATLPVSARPGIDERAPALSPDGRWLAYVSNETGADEVWVRPFPDVGRGSRQLSVDGGVEPVWSGSGNELFFRGRRGLTSVEVGDGADFYVGEVRTLFPSAAYMFFSAHRAYDFEEERDRFLMIRDTPEEVAPAELILIQNFLEEVRARIGG